MKLRIKFKKHGKVRYIGHLDIQRYFQRVNRRAGIKVVYSEGYSPHQKMSFAMPLSVGYESDAEYYDLEVSEASSSKDIVERLNAEQTQGIEVTSCVQLADGCGNAMASVRAAEYTVSFRKGYEPGFDIKKIVSDAMDQDAFIIKKPVKQKNKKKQRISKASYNTKSMNSPSMPGDDASGAEYRETDIKPFIYDMYADEEGAVHFTVSAGSENNIRPDLIMSSLYERAGSRLNAFALQVVRNELFTYADDGKTLISLSDAGKEF